ncbi:MAG: hypothetical protein ACPGSL_06135 [Vicingaceae bacterium]
MNRILKIVSCVVLCFVATAASAQNDNASTQKHIQDLYTLWNNSINSYNVDLVNGDFNSATSFFKKKEGLKQNKSESKSNILNLEGKVKGRDIGLAATGSYVENISPGFAENENSAYDRKVLAGLSWDVLKSGYFSNKNARKIKENKAEMLTFQNKGTDKEQNRIFKWQNLIYSFNKQKVEILKKRLSLAEQRVNIATQLSYLKLVTQKELITNVSSLAEIKSMFNIYQSYNDQLFEQADTSVKAEEFPLVDIDYMYSLQKLKTPKNDTVVALLLENLELENKFINTVSLSAFFRYNYFDLATFNATPSRSFYSVGLQLRVPLNFDHKVKSDMLDAKRDYITSFPSEQKESREKDVLNYFYEFKYKLKQFTNTYHKRLLYQELIRQEKARYRVASLAFNPIDALQLQDNLMQIDIELLDLKQQMYLKLLHIYTEIPQTDIERLIIPFEINDLETQAATSKSIYVWSSSFSSYKPEFITNYLQLNKINTAIMSLNSDNISKPEFNAMTNGLSRVNIASSLLIGRNKLINEDFNQYILAKTKGLDLSKISAIHLDVEPHTLSDWKANKDQYLTKYKNLVEDAKVFCFNNNLKLEISIPLHYPENVIKELYEMCDKVYFMAYENVKTSYIVKKVNMYDLNKTVIALRTNDFNNRLELEEKIIDLKTEISPLGFTIHDLGSLIEFDKK